jgi:Zn-dependent peptidase ImmA (M78 family)
VLRAAGDPIRVEQLLFDLAERFGVSASFIEYRLHRYALVQ